MTPDDAAQAIISAGKEWDACEQDLCLRDIKRECHDDDQTYMAAAFIRGGFAEMMHNWRVRDALRDCAETLEAIASDLRSRRIQDDIEHDRAMRDPRYREQMRGG